MEESVSIPSANFCRELAICVSGSATLSSIGCDMDDSGMMTLGSEKTALYVLRVSVNIRTYERVVKIATDEDARARNTSDFGVVVDAS